ncbi:MAG: CsbD family protein [Pseudomonadales bacterium]
MNSDQVKGRIEQAKGKMKAMFGKGTGNRKTELAGKIEQIVGSTQGLYGDAKEESRKQP